MPLKAKITKEEHAALIKELQSEYVEKDGGYVLTVEGFVPATEFNGMKQKVEEFRDRNRALNREVEDLKPKAARADAFGDLDPDETKTIVAKIKEKGGKGKENDIDEIVQRAVAAAVKPLSEKLTATEQKAIDAERRAADEAFNSQIGAVARKKGARDGSLGYLVTKARDKFEYKNGAIVAKEGVYSPDDPTKPLDPDEFFTQVARTEAPLFEPSEGAGAQHGRPPIPAGARVLRNPSEEQKTANLADIASGKVIVQR